MKHNEIVEKLVSAAESDPNVLGILLFGSVATGTQREDSDIDIITVFQANSPAWGLDNTMNEGIKVGNIYFTYDLLTQSIETVSYLLHPLGEARLPFDRQGTIQPLLEKITDYFADHPEIVAEWNAYYRQLKEEKAEFGYEKTTIIDAWKELEKRHSGGKTRRRFFNAFYLTNPFIFSILKRFL